MQNSNNGLVYAYILDGQGGGQPVDWEQIQSWDKTRGPLWIHLDFTVDHAQHWLRESGGLEEVTADALLADETRPRSIMVNDELLVALRGINCNPGADPEDMVSIRLYSDGDRVITTRRRPLLSARDISEALVAGQGPCTAGELISSIATCLVERMSDVIQDIEDRIDQVEEDIALTDKVLDLRSRLLEIRREIIMLRRYLAPQREAMNRLQSEQVKWISPQDHLQLRETFDKVTRYVEDLDATRDRATVASEELTSRISEQMNNRMYLLSILSGIFLPLGFFTGLLGINVGGIPGADKPLGFIIVMIFLALVVALQIFIFKRNKWL